MFKASELCVLILERGTEGEEEDKNKREEGEQWRGSGKEGELQEDENNARRSRDD